MRRSRSSGPSTSTSGSTSLSAPAAPTSVCHRATASAPSRTSTSARGRPTGRARRSIGTPPSGRWPPGPRSPTPPPRRPSSRAASGISPARSSDMPGLEWTDGACLHDVLARGADASPDVEALVSGPTVYTFGALHDRVARAAAVIDALAAPGARVVFVGDNHPAWVETYYAVPAVGRVLVFGNHRLAATELRSVIERSGATV